MLDWWEKNFATCDLGDKPDGMANAYRRLNERAMSIGKALSQGFGKAVSEIFNGGTVLKRAYEFLPTQKRNFRSLIEPYGQMTAETVAEHFGSVVCRRHYLP